MQSLRGVAQQGVAVLALVDRQGDETWLIDIPPGRPEDTVERSLWKQDMGSAPALTGLLTEARRRYPERQVLLSLEGHGSGYLPSIDIAGMAALASQAEAKGVEWRLSDRDAAPYNTRGEPALPVGFPGLPVGFPGLPVGFPGLPVGFPGLPLQHVALPTVTLGRGLQEARERGCPRLALIHFGQLLQHVG